MIKRLLIVGLYTGIGHLAAILALKFITKKLPQQTVALIGEIDSFTLFVVSILGFGIQLSTTREIALAQNWKEELKSAQSGRLTLSIFLFLAGFSGYLYTKNFLFFIAPIIALNADYALYGKGRSETGALLAMIRVSLPAATLVISSFLFSELVVSLFVWSLLISYFITGFLASKILNVSYLVQPKLKNLRKYLINYRIGIASFSLFFVGIGIINIVPFFYSSSVVASSYIVIKLYMVFKGVKRIMVQAFFKDLQEKEIGLRIDYLAMVLGTILLGTFIFFPKTILPILFDDSTILFKNTFTILAIAGFISSFTTTADTSLLLQKKDKAYCINAAIGALVTIFGSILFYYIIGDFTWAIGLSILIGEATISAANIISLKTNGFVSSRVRWVLPLLILGSVSGSIKLLFGDSIFSFGLFILIFGALILPYSKRLSLV